MRLIFSVSPKIDQVSYFTPQNEQVSYFPSGGNNWPVSILLTIGECLLDFLSLYQTGPILAKKSGPKIWSAESEIR
jgi:hypothetical protein